MFESGGFDLSPNILDRVMAFSTGDSIYVAASILCDPAIVPKPYEIRRIVGNIGRAGLAFLIPPTSPRIKRLGLESYQVINHHPYNGKLEDNFRSTSLHLGFSGYEFPLDISDHGGRNREAFFIESLISVHDRGEWVADLDTISMNDSAFLHRSPDSDQTSCGCANYAASDYHGLPTFPLVAIDTWEELLEKPLEAAVVRARGNWLARLAAAAISVRMGHHTVIKFGVGCRGCGGTILGKVPKEEEKTADKDQVIGYRGQPETIYIL